MVSVINMEKMTYEIETKKRFEYLYKPILLVLISNVMVSIFLYYFNDQNLSAALEIFLVIFLFCFIFVGIPLLILYFNYSKNDSKTTLVVEDFGETFIYKNALIKHHFRKQEIEKVIFYLTPPLFENRTTWMYWDALFYFEIITKKKSFKVTCLVINNFEEYIDEDKIERNRILFPLIK